MRRTYRYPIKANKATIARAEHWLDLCRFVYNCALAQRIMWYKQGKKSLSAYDQNHQLAEAKKEIPELKAVNAQTIREPINRLDLAFKAFFRRVNECNGKAGFPRFKGKDRYDSFTFPEYQNGYKVEGNNLIISKLGTFKLKLHRPIEGDIKTVTIHKSFTGKWYACFSCDNVPAKPLPANDKAIGLDMGIKSFLANSEGNLVNSPKYLRRSERQLKRRQRRIKLARKQGTSQRCKVLGSKRYVKAKLQVAKLHEKVANQRSDFLHKLSKEYIKDYGIICVEDLKIKNMVKNEHLSKSISDSGWGMFFNFLNYKAEGADRIVVKVNPRGTSQYCSNCGFKVDKTLAVRIHTCPLCGLKVDRDINAARNILKTGIDTLHGSGSYALTSALAGVA